MKSKIVLSRECRHKRGDGSNCAMCMGVVRGQLSSPKANTEATNEALAAAVRRMNTGWRLRNEAAIRRGIVEETPLRQACLEFIIEGEPIEALVFLDETGQKVRLTKV